MIAPRENGALPPLQTVLQFHGRYRHLLRPVHVSPMQAGILLFLDRHPGCKLIQVASALCLQSTTMVEAVKLLERKRWIQKARTNANRRIVKLQLMSRGKIKVRRVKAILRKLHHPLSIPTLSRRAA